MAEAGLIHFFDGPSVAHFFGGPSGCPPATGPGTTVTYECLLKNQFFSGA